MTKDIGERLPADVSPASVDPAAPEVPLAYRAVRGGLWVAASSYFNMGFGFLANLVLTRILAPEDFGVFVLAQFFASLLDLRTKIGVERAFAQREESTGELVGTTLILQAASGLASLLLMLAVVPILSHLGYEKAVIWIAVALAGVGFSNSLMMTAWTLLDKHLLFNRVSLASSIVFPLSYVPAFWLAYHGGGYWSLVAQNALYALLLLVTLWWTARRYLPRLWDQPWRFSVPVARQFLRFGLVVGLAMTAGGLVVQVDNWLVGSFVGLATLGYYDRAYRIAQWPSMLIGSVLTRTAFYTYSRLQGDLPRLSKTVSMTCWLITLLALPLALAIFVAAPDLVTFLYGERWLPSVIFVRFLAAYSVLRPLVDIAGSLFDAVGKPGRRTIVSVAQLGTLLGVGTPLTLVYGVIGTCVGVGISFGVGLLLAYWYGRRVVPLPVFEIFGAPVISALLALAGYLLLAQGVGIEAWPAAVRAMVKGGFTAAVFYIALLALQRGRLIGQFGYVWRLVRAGR